MWCVPQTAKIGECFRSAEFLTCDNAQIAIKVNGIFTRNTNQDRAETAIGAPARALKVMQDSGECEPRGWPGVQAKPRLLSLDFATGPHPRGGRIFNDQALATHPASRYSEAMARLPRN